MNLADNITLYVEEKRIRGTTRDYQEKLLMILKRFASQCVSQETSAVTVADVRAYLNECFQVFELNPNTVRFHLKNIGFFLKWCVARGEIAEYPIPAGSIPVVRKKKTDRKSFSVEQYNAILNYTIRLEKFWWNYACKIAWHTSLRLGDVACFRWDCIDWENETVSVTPKKTIFHCPRLEIPIEPELMQLFVDLRDNPRWIKNEWVLGEMRQRYLVHGALLSSWFSKLCSQKLKFGEGYTFHSFRHSFVTRMRTANVPAEIIRSMTGQSLQQVLEYGCVSNEAKRNAFDIVREAQHKAKLRKFGFTQPHYNYRSAASAIGSTKTI